MDKELSSMRLGFLTLYLLKYIEKIPEVGMQPFSALIAQEIEEKNRLRAGKSLVFSRLNSLCNNGFIVDSWGDSSNPKVKKRVKFYSITSKGKKLIHQLEKEQERINNILLRLPS